MRKIAFALVALAALSVSTVFAQDITGSWQGTLQAGASLRVVFVISNGDGGMKAVMHSIDQGGQPIPAGTPVVQGGNVRIPVSALQATFDGKLSADGTTLVGTLTQGGQPLPLTLVRATSDTAWIIPPPVRVVPMAADVVPEFEVTTIKPSKPGTPGKGFIVRGRQFSTLNTSLSDLMTFAYGLHARQIVGGPEWMETEKWDLMAEPHGAGQPNDKQWKAMVQKLLADRFGLTFHHDKKELPVYALMVGKTGQKLTASQGDPNGLPSLLFRGLGVLPAINASMADFTGVMQAAVMDRPVVDQTGLAGKFDFTLTWTPDESQFGAMGVRVPPPTDNPSAPPGLFTALQEQLGLRMDSTKAPVDVLMIDRANHPTPD